MARAETVTKLSLDRWAKILGVNSQHFNGIYWPNNPPTVCQQPWMQRADQAVDRVGREEVAYAIAEAEASIERALGYRLLPSWEIDEWQAATRPYRPEWGNNSRDVRGHSVTLEADWAYFIAGGIRSKELIEAASAVTYTDEDGDVYKETATTTAAVVEAQSPCELKVYYPGHAGEDEWEIKPVNVSITGLVATITFRREQCVLASKYDDLVPPSDDSHLRGVDGSDDANFLTTVDIYRVYNDPQRQVSFLWEPFSSGCWCGGSGCAVCSYSTQTGCLTVRGNPRQSIIGYHPASWNATDLAFDSESWVECRAPDILRLYYYAGWRAKGLPCPTVQMDPEWERTVAYYAAALLDRPICECNNVHAWINHWRFDFASSPADVAGTTQTVASTLDNPLGTTRGAVNAWRKVIREGNAVGRAIHA